MRNALSVAGTSEADGGESRNEVVLIGRVSGTPQQRELPSGDLLVSWRVVLERPPTRRPRRPGSRQVTIDVVDCVAWAAGARRAARGLSDGDVVWLQGALRRRFWRGGAGANSRTEVEVASLRRLRRAVG